MELLRASDIDPTPLHGKRVAILGYGNQGRAQALNLKDSGVEVVVGLRDGSPSSERAEAAGLEVMPVDDAAGSADLVMLLTPDETIGALYRRVEPHLRKGAALGFSHGLAIHFGVVEPRSDLDVLMVAPKGPGTALRSLYQQGKGMFALWAVAQDHSGTARELALAYGRAIGCARAGLIASTFAAECESDLFNEHAVIWGPIPAIMVAGFETLVDGGIPPEAAFLECVGELKLLSGLIEERGLAAMREAISNAAELGALLGGPRIVDSSVKAKMREILSEIRAGRFAEELKREHETDYARLRQARAAARNHPIEQVSRNLRSETD